MRQTIILSSALTFCYNTATQSQFLELQIHQAASISSSPPWVGVVTESTSSASSTTPTVTQSWIKCSATELKAAWRKRYYVKLLYNAGLFLLHLTSSYFEQNFSVRFTEHRLRLCIISFWWKTSSSAESEEFTELHNICREERGSVKGYRLLKQKHKMPYKPNCLYVKLTLKNLAMYNFTWERKGTSTASTTVVFSARISWKK